MVDPNFFSTENKTFDIYMLHTYIHTYIMLCSQKNTRFYDGGDIIYYLLFTGINFLRRCT